jgi:hypothetical protein
MKWRAFIFVLAFCVFVSAWLVGHTAAISRDGPEYIDMARQWGASPRAVVRNYDYAVGYPAAIAGVHWALKHLGWVGGTLEWDVSGQVLSLVGNVAAMAALWLIAEMAFDWRVALTTTLLLEAGRHWALLGADVMSDALAIALEMWAVVFSLWTLRRLRDRSTWAVGLGALTGLCAGVGYLVRPESLAMLILACGLWLIVRFLERLDWGRTVSAMAAAIVVTAGCAAPYMMAIGAITKKKRLGEIVLARAMRLPLATIELKVQGYSPPWALVTQLGEAMHWVVFGFACAWVIAWVGSRLWWNRKLSGVLPAPKRDSVIVMIGAAALLSPMLMGLYEFAGYLDYRHVMVLAMLLSPLAGAGGVFVADFLETRVARRQSRWGAGVRAAALAVVCALMLVTALRPLHEDNYGERVAAMQIAPQLRADDYVLTNSSLFLHYSGGTGWFFNADPTPGSDVLRRIRHGKPAVSVVALRAGFLAANPDLAARLHSPAFVELLRQTKGADAMSVYRVDRSAVATMPK